MNEQRFLELLNLYLDHEISAEDARSLEAEINQNPQRRQVYRQYCLMQAGCVRLFEKDRAEAPHQALAFQALAAANQQIAQRQTRSKRLYWLAGGGLASLGAAACVALVISQVTAPSSDSLVATNPTPATTQTAQVQDTPTSKSVGPKINLDYAAPAATPQWASFASFSKDERGQFRPVRPVDANLNFFSEARLQEAKRKSPLFQDDAAEMTALQFKH